MRIAVLSDIHGNLPALEAILADLRPYDAVWHLGDVVGYGPQPDEVVARLRDADAIGVRGNHDAAAVGEISTGAFNDDAAAALEWTMRHIAPETAEWLRAQPERREETGFTLVHGSPRDPTWEYVFSLGIARGNLSLLETEWCLVGHTHVPLCFSQIGHGVTVILPPAPVDLAGGRAIINPGSVGQPRDGDPRASALLLDTAARTVEWHRVAYPIETVQARMRRAGLPERLAMRLDHGL
jgi:diadenosine tetraphosphatase ApaH/serine/threonine PP2A family protein phosphatase